MLACLAGLSLTSQATREDGGMEGGMGGEEETECLRIKEEKGRDERGMRKAKVVETEAFTVNTWRLTNQGVR